jgi:hypothetical protein
MGLIKGKISGKNTFVLNLHICERRGSWNKESFEATALWHMIEAVMV